MTTERSADKAQVHLTRIWCSVEGCIGYAKWQVDLDGPLLCRKHGRLVRLASRSTYLAHLISLPAPTTVLPAPRLANACKCGDCYHPAFGPNTDGEPCDYCQDCGCASGWHISNSPGSPTEAPQ